MLHRRSRTLGGSSDRAAAAAAARRAVATKGGRGSNGAVTDLLVCFPSRAHLALMPPKAICSPSRPSASEPAKRRHSTSRPGPMPPSGLYKSATAARNPSRRGAADVPVDDEPTSPKVTCVGQIKARPAKPSKGPGGGGGGGKKTKKATWLQALGIKKDAMALLDALHGAFRFNVAGCFGSFPGAVGVGYTSGEDDDEEEEDDAPRTEKETEHGAALARWFMVLEEGNKVSTKKLQGQELEHNQEENKEEDAAPPANALMLMRCRSAPAKGLARRLEAEECEDVKSAAKKTPEEEKEKEKEKESLVLMTYSPDFFKVSLDIAKETWIVGGDDAVLRCRSWKR